MPSDEKGDKPPPELKPYCYRLTTDRESHSQHFVTNKSIYYIFVLISVHPAASLNKPIEDSHSVNPPPTLYEVLALLVFLVGCKWFAL